MSPENIYARLFLEAGAFGYISKEASLEKITTAINCVFNDGKYMSEPVARILSDEFLPEKVLLPI